MEILAMTLEGVLVILPETQQRTIIHYGEIPSCHPLIRDVISYRLGYLAALHGIESASD